MDSINCRVCLRCDIDSNKCLSLFETYNNCSMIEKIHSIADVKITERDGLPNTICPDCLLQLENAVSFKQKCEASNRILCCSVLLIKQCIKQETENSKNESIKRLKEEIKIEVSFNLDEHFADYSESEDRADDPLENPAGEENKTKSRAIDLKLICDDCGGSFKSKCKMRVHWKKVHLAEKLICCKCKRTFKCYKSFRIHTKSKSRTCETATKMRIEGQGKSRIYHCKECNYQTKNLQCVERHLVTHTGERRFLCKDCPKTFTQYASLQSHRERKHKEYKVDTTCHVCGKHLLGRDKFYKHMKTHNAKTVQCKVCKKNLKSKKYLDTHMKRHSGLKSYTCEICAASFFTYGEVYNHRKIVHFKSRNLKCDLCDYKMCTKTGLKKHLSKHTATNIICLVCGQFSENAEKFALHQKRHLERNIPCPQCDKFFHNKKSLNKHKHKIHKCKMLCKTEETTVPNIKQES